MPRRGGAISLSPVSLRVVIIRLVAAVVFVSAMAVICVSTAHADSGNTRADTWGTKELAGSAWLNGGGVDVYSNGSSAFGPSKDTYKCVAVPGGAGGLGCGGG